MSDEEGCEHEHGELEEIVGARLRRDAVSKAFGDVFVGKGSLGDGLGQDRVVASDAGADDQCTHLDRLAVAFVKASLEQHTHVSFGRRA